MAEPLILFGNSRLFHARIQYFGKSSKVKKVAWFNNISAYDERHAADEALRLLSAHPTRIVSKIDRITVKEKKA